MEFYGKKILLNMVYYTLIALLVAVGITFMVFLGTSDIALYSKIGYFILASLFILLVVFDIICTCLNQMKFVSGIILYVLTVATIVMGFVVYALNVTNGLIPTDTVNVFISLIAMSMAMAVISIVIYCVGEKIIEYKTKR